VQLLAFGMYQKLKTTTNLIPKNGYQLMESHFDKVSKMAEWLIPGDEKFKGEPFGCFGTGFCIQSQNRELYIITAGHCIINKDGSLISSINDLRIVSGFGSQNQIKIYEGSNFC
jgi:hypothetical protein